MNDIVDILEKHPYDFCIVKADHGYMSVLKQEQTYCFLTYAGWVSERRNAGLSNWPLADFGIPRGQMRESPILKLHMFFQRFL